MLNRKCFVMFASMMGFLAACAEPVIVPPAGAAEAALDCQALAMEIIAAQQAQNEARSEDRAKASYLLIVPAYVSWYRMDKAEDAARLRREQLEKLSAQKQCPPSATTSPAEVAVPE